MNLNSFADSASGGNLSINLMPKLPPMDSNEYHFFHDNLVGGAFNSIGANSTISATIAKTTGTPLLERRYFSDTLLERL